MTSRTRRLLRALHKALLLHALHEAVEDGNLETVSRLVETTSVDIEGILPEVAVAVAVPVAFAGGETALLKACRMGHLAVVKCLIQAGRANIGATNSRQSTSLHAAAEPGHFGVAHYLLQQANSAELLAAKDVALHTALHYAANGNSVEVALLLIQVAGESAVELVHATNKDGQTALFLATSAAMVQVLVNVGGQSLIFARDSVGQTALYSMAANDEKVDALCRLLDMCDVAHNRVDDKTGTTRPLCSQTETAVVPIFPTPMSRLITWCCRRLGRRLGRFGRGPLGLDTLYDVQAGGGQRGRVDLIMARDQWGGTALHEAATLGCYETTKVLVTEGGVDLVMAVDENSQTALHIVAETAGVGSFDTAKYNTAKYLLKEGGEQLLYATNKHGDNAFHHFVSWNRVAMVDYMINECGVDVNIFDGKSNTALLRVVQRIVLGRPDHGLVARLVRSHHANVNLCDAHGRTALHILCCPSADPTVDVLAFVRLIVEEGGADVHAVDHRRRTALHYACGCGTFEIVDYLVNHAGANIFAVDDEGRSPLLCACSTSVADGLAKIRLLVEANGGHDLVEAADIFGRTPLQYVSRLGNLETVEYLVNNAAADIHASDNAGQTVLHYACSTGEAAALAKARLLVNAGVDIFTADVDGRTALHAAATTGQNAPVVLLLLPRFKRA